MLFDIDEAVKVRAHYKDLLVGTPLTHDSSFNIDGIFMCHKGTVHKAINILVDNDFDERYPFVGVTDEKDKCLELFVYAYVNGDVFYHELDKNLTEKGIPKIYNA